MIGPTARGIAAALAACLIGAAWHVATRLGATTTLAPIDLALLRFTIPAVILAPIWLRTGLLPRQAGAGRTALLVLGGGLPFGLTVIAGAQWAPAAHMGAMLPGAMPLFVALLAALVLRERYAPARLAGFALIVAGIAALGSGAFAAAPPGAWRGDLLFLGAAFLWAVFTVAFRGSGLTPWQGAALVNAWSALLAVPAWLLAWHLWGTGRIATAPWQDIALQVAMQGLVAGVCGLWTFAAAVALLGASRAAAYGALVPVMSALGGWALLGEPIAFATGAALAVTAGGVALASGALRRRRDAAGSAPAQTVK
ncbi:MAG: DMT family transporter [Alphaproteobacteria bacterium]|nr:DMT family transporter [Alphaproteobacteria bacterium]